MENVKNNYLNNLKTTNFNHLIPNLKIYVFNFLDIRDLLKFVNISKNCKELITHNMSIFQKCMNVKNKYLFNSY